MPDVTEWLHRLDAGDPSALDQLLPLVYEELKSLARRRRTAERQHHTLTATALVHETYLRLVKQRRLNVTDREDFLAIAAVMMQRVLVDYARARTRKKRGGKAQPISLTEISDVDQLLSLEESQEVLDLSEALERLEEKAERAAIVVRLRFYGGMSVDDIAKHLKVNVRTIHRDWVAARAWLRKEVANTTLFDSREHTELLPPADQPVVN